MNNYSRCERCGGKARKKWGNELCYRCYKDDTHIKLKGKMEKERKTIKEIIMSVRNDPEAMKELKKWRQDK